jgi:type IV pilus assembly protein PilZ
MFERVHGRAPVRVRVQFRSASSLLVAYSINLSRGGMFLETATPPEVGTALDLVLESAGGVPVPIRGRVTWRRAAADAGGPAGVGIEFDDLSDALGATIDGLVARFTGVNILLFCPDARERDTLRRMLRSAVTAAEVVAPEALTLCEALCDETMDLVVIEADEDGEAAARLARTASDQAPPIPVVVLTSDDAVAGRMREVGAGERVGNPPAMADLSRAVVRALGRPSLVGPG